MRGARHQLTNRTVQTKTEPGRYADGGGLYLVVTKRGTKNWCFMYRWDDKRPELGFGGYPDVSLANARSQAEIARGALNSVPRRNPKEVFTQLKQKPVGPITLGAFTEEFLDRILGDFKNAKHRQQWRNTLRTYAAPINNQPLDKVTTEDILSVLTPIWDEKRETARRVQGRLERVLNAAKAQGLRSGENPAQWKGHLETVLPNNRTKRHHHKALPYDDLQNFMSALRARNALSALCLEFIILTCVRSAEGRNVTWDEIDFDQRVWTIKQERMKMGKVHRIPLSVRAIEITQQLHEVRTNEFVFPGRAGNTGISEASVRKLLLNLNRDGVTTHGFRSTFRDWVFEMTDFPRELAEIALSHNVGDATERAYRRGDALEKRRDLMEAWSDFAKR